MTESDSVRFGVIQTAEADKRYGIILDEHETKVFFTFDAVDVGYPAPGETVHFVPDETAAGPIARHVVVLSAVARGKWQRAV